MKNHLYILIILILLFTLSCKRQDFFQESIDPSEGRGVPTISLIGNDLITIPLWDTLTDPGATARDVDGNPLSVIVQSNVDINLAGTYLITYTATDVFGKQASIQRRVDVVIEQKHYIDDWDVDHDCRTTTAISMLDNDASVSGAFGILNIDHDGKNTIIRISGDEIRVDPSPISILVTNSYIFTGTGKMAPDGNSFKIYYNYQGVNGLARDGSCIATYTRK